MKVEDDIAKLGLKLPKPPKPVGTYVPTVRVGNLIYTSGQGPSVEGELRHKGKIGKDLTLEQGYEAARLAALNCLSAVKAEIGDLDKVERVIKVTGFVNSADGFNKQPQVMNGATELLVKLFEQEGYPARTSIGVNELPNDIAVEVEMIVQVKG